MLVFVTRALLVLASLCPASYAAESGPVTMACSSAERELFFPQGTAGKPVWHEPTSVSQAMLCRTINRVLDLSTEVLYAGKIKSSISHPCWKAVAGFWSGAQINKSDKASANQTEAMDFLRAELGAFVDSMEQVSVPTAEDGCYVFSNPQHELKGHLRSFQETLAARVQALKCSKDEVNAELEIWAKKKLELYYTGAMYDGCRASKGSSLSRLKECEKTRAELIASLQKKGSLDYQSCVDAVSSRKGPKPESWTRAADYCSSGSLAKVQPEYQVKLEAIRAKKNGFTFQSDMDHLNREYEKYKPCNGLQSECRNLVVSALEHNVGLCPIPNGMGYQTGGTCAFHAIAAAIYMSGKSCDKMYSVGQLQSMAKVDEPWDTTHGFGVQNLAPIEKSLAEKGVRLKQYDEALTNITHVPMVVTVRVGELKSWSDTGFADMLIRDKAADSSAKDPGYHALLVTDIVTQTVKGVATKMAVIRDANGGYAPYLVPLDTLTEANRYYARESCSDPKVCAPPALEVGRP